MNSFSVEPLFKIKNYYKQLEYKLDKANARNEQKHNQSCIKARKKRKKRKK